MCDLTNISDRITPTSLLFESFEVVGLVKKRTITASGPGW